jgi:urease accessory protein
MMSALTAERSDLAARPQRGLGQIALGFRVVEGVTRIERFFQAGCLKARLPRAHGAGAEAVLMNISGGIAGGDALNTEITLGPGAAACVAGQAAERVYRALGGVPARVATRIAVGPGAALDYLPQETILFDGFALARSLDVELAADARYLGVESLVFGRQAMGEQLRAGWLRDRIALRRGGKPVLTDMTRLEGDIAAQLGRPALGGGAVAMASIMFAAPEAKEFLAPARAVLAESGCDAGASLVDGVLVARLLAPTSQTLRRAVVKFLVLCRNGRAMPGVWQG